MNKALVVGLGLALSSGVVHAQAKKPAAKKAKPAIKRAEPAPTPNPAATTLTPTDAAPPPTIPPPSAAAGGTTAAKKPGAPISGTPQSPNKTDEKAGVDEKLEKQGEAKPWVEGVSAAEQQQAQILFRDGNLQLNDGLFVNAVNKYREAIKHWDHPAIHYNLSLALLNLDQPIEVFDELNKALKYGAAPLEKDKYDHAKEYLLLVEKQLADVEVSCDKIGAKVSVDGKEVFIAPGKFSQKVRVGKHTFYADKQGYNARITAPYIGPGEKFRIELKLYTAEELTGYRRRWDNTWFPYVVLGAGAAIGLGAAGLELSAQSSYDEFNKQVAACNMTSAGCAKDTPGITDAKNSGDTKRTLGYVGYGVAGAAIATGAVLLYVNRRQSYQRSVEEIEAERTGAPPIAVTPMISSEAMGAMVQGSF